MLKRTIIGRKQRSGFTLVELLAVIVILAIILAVAVPTISSLIQDAKEKAFAANAKMMIKAIDYKMLEDPTFDPTDPADLNINNIESVLGVDSANMSAFTVAIENGKPSVSISGDAQWSGLSASGTFAGIVVIDTTAIPNYTYYSTTEGVNVPQLATGMTPIKWDASNNEVTTTVSDPNWYDYTTKKWANAKTADGSYWVWIPRYAYRITTGYQSNTTGTIDVKFLTDTSNTSADGTSIVAYSNGNSATNFVPHPAFNFGGTQVTGMWVAKFEPSNTGGKIKSIPYDSVTAPSVTSWQDGDYNISMYFNAIRAIETDSYYGWGTSGTNLDTHMMKNTEWGAVAYLSKSIYGKETEVWINNNRRPGCAGNSVSEGIVYGCQNEYDTTGGFNASTTGNITGIYDMVGGNYEYVMGNYDNVAGSSGFNPSGIDDKYIDRYTSTEANYGYNNTHYGDAYYETSLDVTPLNGVLDYGKLNLSWNGDYSIALETNFPWIIRGGSGGDGSSAGLFCIYNYNGSSGGFRIVLLTDLGL